MDAGEASKWGAALGGLLMGAAALYKNWADRRKETDTAHLERDRLAEEERQKDLDRLYKGLWEHMNRLEENLKEHEATIREISAENVELRGDKVQLAAQIRDQDRQIGYLKQRVTELEATLAKFAELAHRPDGDKGAGR